MAFSGKLATAATATTNPSPSTLGTPNPYPTPTIDVRTVSAAWTSQAVKALFPRQARDGSGKVSLPVLFIPSGGAAVTYTVTIWQYHKESGNWFQHVSNASTNLTGFQANLILNLYLDQPIYIQLSSISSGTIDIWFDNGLAYGR